jgi:hypothetical protein
MIFVVCLSSYSMIANEEPVSTKLGTCENSILLFPEMGGEIRKRQSGEFCFDKGRVNIVSKNCEKKCTLISKAMSDIKPLKYSSSGTPGSWLCDRYGGQARVLFFENKGTRSKQNFCILGAEIISTPYLLKIKLGSKK